MFSLVTTYRATQILLASALLPGVQPQIFPDAVLDFILNSNLVPE